MANGLVALFDPVGVDAGEDGVHHVSSFRPPGFLGRREAVAEKITDALHT